MMKGKTLKVWRRDTEKYYIERNKDLYQPRHRGYYSHSHALYTAYFVEKFQNYFPKEFLKHEGDQDSLINLSAMHHKPESPLKLIISEADHLNSGIDREEIPEGKPILSSDVVKTP